MKTENRNSKKKNFPRPLSFLCAALAVACAGVGAVHYLEGKNAGREYEQLRAEAAARQESTEGAGQAEAKTEDLGEPEQEASGRAREPEKEPVEIPVDFEALWEQNEDVYAWITVPGTNIDYPILRSPDDNFYYLNHSIDRVEAKEGAIYTEDYNDMEFEDPHTVIYGHNMKNGSMFRTLHNYEDWDFFENNREVRIYTPDAIRYYRIFAAYVYDNRHLLVSFDFHNPEAFQDYLDEVFERKNMNDFVDTDMEVTAEDKIITLSTCNKGNKSQRYLVQAVLVSIES